MKFAKKLILSSILLLSVVFLFNSLNLSGSLLDKSANSEQMDSTGVIDKSNPEILYLAEEDNTANKSVDDSSANKEDSKQGWMEKIKNIFKKIYDKFVEKYNNVKNWIKNWWNKKPSASEQCPVARSTSDNSIASMIEPGLSAAEPILPDVVVVEEK